ASGQSQCSEYSTPSTLSHPQEHESYDGAVRVIRSPLIYNTPLQDQQSYLSHQQPTTSDHQLQGLPTFSGYLQHKEEESTGGNGSDLISKLALKTDPRMTQPAWFTHIGLSNDKSQSLNQMTAYQQNPILSGTTDTSARSTSGYSHDGVMDQAQCTNLIPWNHFEGRTSCVGDTNLCETVNYQVGFATTS
ncbi:unnamed protein product, partial [Hymenolepis diminuta]